MSARSIAEIARLAALEGYRILDTAPEQSFDDLTEVAAAICGVPISLVSFVSGDRQWFKAEKGLGLRETPRASSFCAHTLENGQTLVVPDTLEDTRFRSNALVVGDPEIRFYAGAPIVGAGGHALGTVCVIDKEPRTLSVQQVSALEALARQAAVLLDRRTLLVENTDLVREAARALAAAEQSREQLQLAMDAAELAAWYYDPERNIVGGDERMAALFGLETPEGPAEVWLAAVAEEDRARVGKEFAAGVAGAPYDTKYRIRIGDSIRWLHARAKVMPHADGSVWMAGICEDITREESLAADLAKTAERLALAQSVSGAVTFDWDVERDAVAWGGEVLGRHPSEIPSSRHFFPLLPEPDREALGQAVAAALRTGEEYRHEFRAHRPDGSLRWMSTVGKPLRNALGKVVSVVGINRDITDRKLAEEVLLQSEKLAAVGRLASTISHEINNPLEAVTNLLYIVRQSPELSGANRDYLETADRELARVSHITAQTLRFHRSPLNPTPIRADELLREVLDLYSTRLPASSIAVELRNTGDAVFTAFEGDIRQVLNNLVGNAFSAMRNGGTLKLRSRRGTEWRGMRQGVAITVADNGTGIGQDAKPRIFEAFYSTKGIGGTGLGLWISQRIVHKHKGRLSFRSRMGQPHGTVFRLWLPTEVAGTAGESWAQ